MSKRSGREVVKIQNQKIMKLMKAIRSKCRDCMAGQHLDCQIPDCSLYPYRPYKGR